MALSKVDYNSLNVTAAASKALKWNSGADGFETGDIAGAMVLLETQTASSSATIDFTSNIDSTYKEYIFTFINMHPSANADLTFQGSIDSGSNYNVAMTTTVISPYHYENDTGGATLYYNAPKDQAQGTAFQSISSQVGSDADQSVSGSLHLFNPASTTFVKHFICNVQTACDDGSDPYQMQDLSAGYFNTTSAVDAIQFKMDSGNLDAGTFKLYGVT